MASPSRMHVLNSLPLFFLFFFSVQFFAEGLRKIPISKLPNRVLMSAQSSSPSFYNAFDTTFQNAGSMYTNNLNNKDSVDFHDNINKDDSNSNYKGTFNKGFSASNDDFYPTTYTNKYDSSNEDFAASDFKPKGGKYSYPTFSAPSSSSESLYGRKFPASFEASVANKESYSTKQSYIGKESPSSSGQQGLYSSPSSEKSLYTSPLYASPSNYEEQSLFEAPFANKESYTTKDSYGKESPSSSGQQGLYSTPSSEQESLYSSPSSEKGLDTSPLYFSPSNEKRLDSSTPLYASPSNKQSLYSSNYKATYPFNAMESPYMPKVSQFDEFTKSHPVSNYDSYFNTPTINKVHTFPLSDHDLTYGQVQVP